MQVANSPVFQEYQLQVSHDGSALVDLTALWGAAGRPKGRSPRQWAAREDAGGARARSSRRPAGRFTPVLAPADVALDYAMHLDTKIQMAANEVLWTKIHADPARSLIECPDPIMALFAVGAVADAQDITAEEAATILVSEAVEQTVDLDPYKQETSVAKVQRAIGGDARLLDEPGNR